jgi:PAB-dependent poly(A)-specific ribonuclease subunit 2
VRPSRLGLARVSVVRGAGPAKGTCCIDDYIRGVEPVYDYLTKFRLVGLAGDWRGTWQEY